MTSTIALIEPEEQARIDAKAVSDEYRETIHKLIADLLNAKCGWPSDLELAASTELTTLLQRVEKAEARSEFLLKENHGLGDEICALSEQRDEAMKALEPFSDMAGELFARNWNASDIVVVLDNPNDPHRVTAGDFFRARAARNAMGEPE